MPEANPEAKNDTKDKTGPSGNGSSKAGSTCILMRGVGKHFGKTRVLEKIDLDIKTGEFCVFVGPSGCGKSTLLRLIAGLESVSSGDLSIDGQRMNDVEPSKRGIAMVFQSYALYPHMTVYKNLAFGLKLGQVEQGEADRRIREAARMLQIEQLLDRLPKQLSGGQRQRVAIGRAITRQPKIFLFDEPLSNLDAALRVSMRSELSRLHKQLKTTMVYVTHDQVEAMTMADRIVILNAGHVEQFGPPLEVYHRPRTVFAAGFLGSPKMNFMRGDITEVGGDSVTVKLTGGGNVKAAVKPDGAKVGDTVTVGFRPEHLKITAGDKGGLTATVQLVEDLGDHSIMHLDRDAVEGRVLAKVEKVPATEGQTVSFEIPAAECHVFDAKGMALARRD
ncbi:MAG TPA: sn-glycerol-3-phosphate ABC transporter ATP-binding protein UgpC [Kofleriaceae bacterium]|nr:sn-glycerol-3-phosphate ABC transporter ATP-binding protein UgpC [Kofleriaceae bacterium]